MSDLRCTFCGDYASSDSEGLCCLRCGDPLVACAVCYASIRSKPVDRKAPREIEQTVAMLRVALELHHWHSGAGRCTATAAPPRGAVA